MSTAGGSLPAETEERILASDVDAAFGQRRRREEGLAEVVGGQRLRVRSGADDNHDAVLVGEVDVSGGRHGRGAIRRRGRTDAPRLHDLAGVCATDGEDAAVPVIMPYAQTYGCSTALDGAIFVWSIATQCILRGLGNNPPAHP